MNIIQVDFQGQGMAFRQDGWFNATVAAAAFGKRLHHYMENAETREYTVELARQLNHRNPGDLIRASRGRGGGTWFHPKLAVHFARWLSVEFSVWCDIQIDRLVRGDSDWKRSRHATASSHKVMCEILRVTRLAEGKETKAFHYSNEARLVNWLAGAEFAGLDRDALTVGELDALAALEIQNAVMIGSRIPYEERKSAFAQTRALPEPSRQLPVRKRKRLPDKAA